MQRRVQELVLVAEVVDVDVADAHRVQRRLQRRVGAVRDPGPVQADDRVDVRLHVPELRGDLGQLFERAGHRQAATLHELVLVVAPLDVLVVLGGELGSHVQRSVEQRVGKAVLLVAVEPAPQVRHPVQVVGQVQEAADRPVLEALAGGDLRQVRDVAHGQRDLLLLRIRHLVEGELDVQGFLHVDPYELAAGRPPVLRTEHRELERLVERHRDVCQVHAHAGGRLRRGLALAVGPGAGTGEHEARGDQDEDSESGSDHVAPPVRWFGVDSRSGAPPRRPPRPSG